VKPHELVFGAQLVRIITLNQVVLSHKQERHINIASHLRSET